MMPAVWCHTDPGGERGETAQSDKIMNEIYFSKVGFVAVMVINCTVGMECKSQKIFVFAAAAAKYFGLRDFTAALQGVLNGVSHRLVCRI